MAEWPIEDAKSKFGTLVKAALAGEPQRVTRQGQPAVVVLAMEEYERLCRLENADAPSLGELLLEVPQDDGEFERLPLRARPLDLYCFFSTPTCCQRSANANGIPR